MLAVQHCLNLPTVLKLAPANYTPNIRSMWGYIVFTFHLSVCLFVRSFVCSFVLEFARRVKVFVLKFIRPHILKTDGFHSYLA